MPITQDRMLALISAARDFQDTAEKMEAYTRRSCQIVREGKGTAQEQLDYLELMLDLKMLLRDPLNSPAIILVEERHFKSAAGRNRAAARRAKEARGAPERKTPPAHPRRPDIELEAPWPANAPQSLARQHELKGSVIDSVEAEEVGVPLPMQDRRLVRQYNKTTEPPTKGPKNAPGLYDDDEPDLSHGIIEPERQRSPEELAAAIAADLLREENLEIYENGKKDTVE